MEKKPFTNAGLQALLDELYQLDDTQLQIQATEILLEFKTWIADHFILTAAQLTFMDKIDQRMIGLLAAQTSVAVNNRLDITLTNEPKLQNADEEKKKKIIRSESKVDADADSEGEYDATGDVNIIIEYEPIN